MSNIIQSRAPQANDDHDTLLRTTAANVWAMSQAESAAAGNATAGNQVTQITAEQAIALGVGTDITSPSAMPAGGAGIRGWLSAIWTKINGSIGVTGTFWQATQPVSAATLPLPTGAATDVTSKAIPGFVIPAHDEIDCTYVGSTNNLSTVVYKLASSTLATLTFTYVGGTPAADDALIATIVKS